jgi:MYXO-CTERM domain-containing protein
MKGLRAGAMTLATAAALLAAPVPAHAVSYLGGQFVALGGSVTVRYISSSAAYFNTMQWFRNGYGAVSYNVGAPNTVNYGASGTVDDLFYNKNGYRLSDAGAVPANSAGDVVTLGGGYMFAPGQEVLLGLFVHNEGTQGAGGVNWKTQDADDYTYFTGPTSRNKDNTFHLVVTALGPGVYQFSGGWEDKVNGGDLDYNDVIFEISGVTVTPEPVSMALMATGLAGLAGFGARRRRRREEDGEAAA